MNVDAIVVKTEPFKDYDRLVVLYSHQLGKFSAIAKGSLRHSSRQSPALDQANEIKAELVFGRREMSILTGTQSVHCWSGIKSSPLKWAVASFVLEVIDRLVYDHQQDSQLWLCIKDSLSLIEAAENPLAGFKIIRNDLIRTLGYGGYSSGNFSDDDLIRLAGGQVASLNLLRHLAKNGDFMLE